MPPFALTVALCCLTKFSSIAEEPAEEKPPLFRVDVDFAKPQGRISPDLFGTNDLECVNISKWQGKGWTWDEAMDPGFQKLMTEIACPIVRIHLMEKMDKIFPARGAAPDWSQVDCMDRTFSQRPGQRILFCFTREPAWMDMAKAEDRALFAKDCAALANHLVNEKHYPIAYWDFYNEPYNNTPLDDARSFWQLYNLMAPALHAATPGVKVGGPGTASPNARTMEDFLAHCAANVDFITWHYYPSGKEPMPTADLIDQTTEFGGDVRKMRALVEKYLPGRSAPGSPNEVPLILGEYNLCWAWTPSDPRQATPVGAVWGASVLKNIIDAKASGAMTWLACGNGSFGLISATNEMRPFGTFLSWMNRWVGGAMQVQARSSTNEIEALAATSAKNDILLLINKTGKPRKIILSFTNNTAPREATCHILADGQPAPVESKTTLFANSRAEETIDLPPISLRLYVLEKSKQVTKMQ